MPISDMLDAMTADGSVCYGTPDPFYGQLNLRWGPFTLDPAATSSNAKCKKFFTEADNGLVQSWKGHRVFINPPYSAETGQWMEKIYTEAARGTFVVALVFARTDTLWWQQYAMCAPEIYFTCGRISYTSPTGIKTKTPFFGSAVLVYPGRVLSVEDAMGPRISRIFKSPEQEATFALDCIDLGMV